MRRRKVETTQWILSTDWECIHQYLGCQNATFATNDLTGDVGCRRIAVWHYLQL